MRPSGALIYVAIAVIAISVTAMVYRLTPLPLEMAAMGGAVLFFALAVMDQIASRAADRTEFQRQIDFGDQALQDAFNEIDMIRSRMVALETDTQQIVDAGVAPVHQDMQAVGALLAQVTETVADTDHRIITLEEEFKLLAARPPARASTDAPKAQVDEGAPAQSATDQSATSQSAPVKPAATKRTEAPDVTRSRALLKRVAKAVENEQIEVMLQSIITLPQRRARGFATLFNLHLDGSGTLEARHAVPAVEAAGASADFDKAVVSRGLALAKKFASRESASIVFVPVSASAIMQSRFADWLVKVLTENQDLVGRFVLEITQKDVRSLSPLDFDLLQSLADLGFRMSVTQLTDARGDLFDLSRYGFRYAKAPAALFLGTDAEAKSDIHPEDLSDMAARNGMDLIVDQVESESQVVELLDCSLKYGQGNLFARPRAVDIEPVMLESEQVGTEPQADPQQNQAPPKKPVARALSRSA